MVEFLNTDVLKINKGVICVQCSDDPFTSNEHLNFLVERYPSLVDSYERHIIKYKTFRCDLLGSVSCDKVDDDLYILVMFTKHKEKDGVLNFDTSALDKCIINLVGLLSQHDVYMMYDVAFASDKNTLKEIKSVFSKHNLSATVLY